MIIFVSIGYRRLQILNSLNIEKILTDGESNRILNEHTLPAFKKGNYYQGILNGLHVIIKKLTEKIANVKLNT